MTVLHSATDPGGSIVAIKDALTALALIAAAAFTYFKFVKGRILGPRARLTTRAALAPSRVDSTGAAERVGIDASVRPGIVFVTEVLLRNEGQIVLYVPRHSEALVTISSVTVSGVNEGSSLSAAALSWKRPDAYYASTNLLLEEGQAPTGDLRLEPNEELRLAAVFPVPAGHQAAAFLVDVHVWVESRTWFRRAGRYWDTRGTMVPGDSLFPSEGKG